MAGELSKCGWGRYKSPRWQSPSHQPRSGAECSCCLPSVCTTKARRPLHCPSVPPAQRSGVFLSHSFASPPSFSKFLLHPCLRAIFSFSESVPLNLSPHRGLWLHLAGGRFLSLRGARGRPRTLPLLAVADFLSQALSLFSSLHQVPSCQVRWL